MLRRNLDYETLDELDEPDSSGYVGYKWELHVLDGFLQHYGTLSLAASDAGVPLEMVEKRLEESPQFKGNLDYARKLLKAQFYREIVRRSLEPVEEPIFIRGKKVGVKLVYDNQMLRWTAERLFPEDFHLQSRIEAGSGDGEVRFKLELNQGKQEE